MPAALALVASSAPTREAAAFLSPSPAAAGSPTSAGDGDKKAAAARVGAELASRAKAAGITSVVFDRGGFQYQGRVRALAEAAREGGLDF